jgi:hypothetical protein
MKTVGALLTTRFGLDIGMRKGLRVRPGVGLTLPFTGNSGGGFEETLAIAWQW